MRTRRRAVSPAERAAASARICERLAAMNPASPIAVYMASADEIDLAPFIKATMSKLPGRGTTDFADYTDFGDHAPIRVIRGLKTSPVRLVAPRWNGAVYELAELGGELVAGPHGILEPPQAARRVAANEVGAWIVPGLAFTRDGKRLGYGGGWYDRMMAGARADARKIGVGYQFQIVDDLPSEPHDIRLDEIVTDV